MALASLQAQPRLAGETEIRLALEKLNTVGSVMMIAAHPDDENTALLAYFARGRHVRTAYLSLTRGEGGQNLIGSEQGDELGVIRTQELLAARRIDGAEQYFTRAIDFGFTKTVAETFAKWPHEKVLADVVWDIRRFRPDVIVLRFSGTPRDGHGQHQVSAILGREAFTAAADSSRFPEQLQWVQPWQARRLFYNAISFTAQQEHEAAQTPDRIEIDLGEYSPELGYSYGEIAGMSRSQHRSQGMGAAERKGSQKNYLITIAGDKATKDTFDGIDTTWNRLPGGASFGALLTRAESSFIPASPEQLLPILADARRQIAEIHDPLAVQKLADIDETMALCSGLWLDSSSDKFEVSPGGSLKVSITALSRSRSPATLIAVRMSGVEGAPALDLAPATLVYNQPSLYSLNVKVPDSEPYTQPYWLEQPKDGDLYSVRDPRNIGLPENPTVLTSVFRVNLAGTSIELTRPVEHRYVDRVYGAAVRPLAIVPPVAVDLTGHSLIFPDTSPRKIEVPVKANVSKASGDLRLEAPEGWRIQPASLPFTLEAVDQQVSLTFEVTPPGSNAVADLRAVATVGSRSIALGTEIIQYPHIPTQTLFPPADTRLVRADIKTLARHVGYIMGAGDEMPRALEQIGCDVALLSPDDLMRGNLQRFDAIVTGVRAFNTRPDLRLNFQRLLDYTSGGGALIVQYVTSEGATPDRIGPYPIRIGRERVTVEDAPVTFPNPENPLLHSPNQIIQGDFDGWIQERGLNFATEWDSQYQTVLESHDPDEKPLEGGELYARIGKGVYIFSAYSWFRELPAGVPGAYRLFANMLSASKAQ